MVVCSREKNGHGAVVQGATDALGCCRPVGIQDTPRTRSHQGHGRLVDSRPGPVCPNVADDDLNATSKPLNQNALLLDIEQEAQRMQRSCDVRTYKGTRELCRPHKFAAKSKA